MDSNYTPVVVGFGIVGLLGYTLVIPAKPIVTPSPITPRVVEEKREPKTTLEDKVAVKPQKPKKYNKEDLDALLQKHLGQQYRAIGMKYKFEGKDIYIRADTDNEGVKFYDEKGKELSAEESERMKRIMEDMTGVKQKK